MLALGTLMKKWELRKLNNIWNKKAIKNQESKGMGEESGEGGQGEWKDSEDSEGGKQERNTG